MPELPEVETVARDLAAQITGATIQGVARLDWPRMLGDLPPEAFAQAIAGRRIARIGRRAKWLILALDQGWTLAIHLRMSGSMGVDPPDAEPDRHTHLVLRLTDDRLLSFRDVRKFGRAHLLDASGYAALDAAHGPEPLEPGFTADVLRGRLAGRAAKLKPTLLNQAVVAGLGNIYVDESLWLAKLHPERAAASLSAEELGALHAAIVEVLAGAVERRGSTLRDYRTGYGAKGDNQDRFVVYDRRGVPCPRCGTPVVKTTLAQRGTHLCPTCQVT
jgi:formamidopyrimidine-DNA glycosylase